MIRTPVLAALLAAGAAVALVAAPAQDRAFFPIEDIRPGMVGVGRTVFEGDTLEEFRATVIGVLRNALGARRDLILARLEGGPLATTGVIQGMSGSPVYIDGRLAGAVAYSLGSFSKEPIAGITPILEMTADVDTPPAPRPLAQRPATAIDWAAAHPDDVFSALERVLARATAMPVPLPGSLRVVGPASLADLMPSLRPIGAAMVLSGFDPTIERGLRQALAMPAVGPTSPNRAIQNGSTAPTLRPGDAVGVGLVHGDMNVGATGTVTHVDNGRVYAFGHPFLNLGPSSYTMTRAHVYTVLPSFNLSMKIATLGSVIGTVNQDRTTAVGGTLGASPGEFDVRVTLASDRAPAQQFSLRLLRDPLLTPLFSYAALLSAVTSYEREVGATSVTARGVVSFGADGEVVIDDMFSGQSAVAAAIGAATAPIDAAMSNPFKLVVPERLELELRTSEQEDYTTIERVWLDTVRPHFGQTHTLQVQLQDYRGSRRTISLPVVMPAQANGPVTLLVSDAATLTSLERRDLQPGRPTDWAGMLADMNAARRNNRLYVRVITAGAGTVVGGETLPALPASVQSVLGADTSVARAPVLRTVAGAWEHRLDKPVRGSRELTLTLSSRP